MLTEVGLERMQPMYMGKDRIKLESILKSIKNRKKAHTVLKVYALDSDELKFLPQSNFYNILDSKPDKIK